MTAVIDRLNAALADRYQILQPLGQGGMATVYLAQDLRHDRRVALKVLRPELAAVIGADRFLNEIKVTANLQHPNILALYDSGEADTFLYYVMPFVQGESLRDRLNRETQLPIEDSIRITQSVAAALDYAHRHDVIHRDIKPANILLHDGQPMVADFGIALAVTQAGGERLTETGLSVGTPHYMSPEQAMGDRELDGRSDQYSLACVMYEMLAGEPPHTGPNSQAVVAKILTENPKPITEARRSTPPAVAAALEIALEKLPADRFHTTDAFAAALTGPVTGTYRPRVAPGAPRPLWFVILGIAAAALAFVIGRATAPSHDPTDAGLARFSIRTTEGTIPGAQWAPWVAISRDGARIAYRVNRRGEAAILVRPLEALSTTAIPGLQDAMAPTFSPDGQWLAFARAFDIFRIPVAGGAAERLASGAPDITWNHDGSILVGDGSGQIVSNTQGVRRIPAGGGDPEPLTQLDPSGGEYGHSFPQLLPGGEQLLVTVSEAVYFGARTIAVIDLSTGERTKLVTGTRARYAATGHLVWAEPTGRLLASAFDPKRLELTGPTITLAEEVSGATADGVAQFEVTDGGALIYVPAQPRQLVVVDRAGRTVTVFDPPGVYHSPRYSPDGRQIAVDISEPSGRDIWVINAADGSKLKVTFSGNTNDPVWAPDGRSVTYGSAVLSPGSRRGVYRVALDGATEPESLFVGADGDRTPGAWFPDGRSAITIAAKPTGWQLETLEPGPERTPVAMPNTRPEHAWPALSPDGRWLAYQSNETGRPEVYVRPVSGSGGRAVVSRDGGTSPVWHPSGRELFYRHPTGTSEVLVAARIDTGPPVRVVSRTELFATDDIEAASPHTNYDVHPNGEHFVMVRIQAGSEIIYIQNWTKVFEQP